jgi:hypothetical protein
VADKLLSGCLGVSLAINSWGAIKQQRVPWPGTFIRIGVAFGIIGVVAHASDDLADILACGFLLASLVNLATTQGQTGPWTQAFGAVPPGLTEGFPFYTLGWGGQNASVGPNPQSNRPPGFIGPVAPRLG